jgi:hypothetical protein
MLVEQMEFLGEGWASMIVIPPQKTIWGKWALNYEKAAYLD